MRLTLWAASGKLAMRVLLHSSLVDALHHPSACQAAQTGGSGGAKGGARSTARRTTATCLQLFTVFCCCDHACSGGAKGNDERDQTLNQMLSEMDGFDNEAQVGCSFGNGTARAEWDSG